MKNHIFFLVILAISLLPVSSAWATGLSGPNNSLEYTVSTTNIALDRTGKGSFTITVTGLDTPVIGIQYLGEPADGVG